LQGGNSAISSHNASPVVASLFWQTELSPLLQATLTACGATVPHDMEIWSRRGHCGSTPLWNIGVSKPVFKSGATQREFLISCSFCNEVYIAYIFVECNIGHIKIMYGRELKLRYMLSELAYVLHPFQIMVHFSFVLSQTSLILTKFIDK
jgi:hypothetical protein